MNSYSFFFLVYSKPIKWLPVTQSVQFLYSGRLFREQSKQQLSSAEHSRMKGWEFNEPQGFAEKVFTVFKSLGNISAITLSFLWVRLTGKLKKVFLKRMILSFRVQDSCSCYLSLGSISMGHRWQCIGVCAVTVLHIRISLNPTGLSLNLIFLLVFISFCSTSLPYLQYFIFLSFVYFPSQATMSQSILDYVFVRFCTGFFVELWSCRKKINLINVGTRGNPEHLFIF